MKRELAALWVVVATSAVCAQGTTTASASERFAACVVCHGEGGVSRMPMTPSLAGQPSFYAITQLFLFREGRRTSDAMNAVAKGMSDDDLRTYSELIAKLPPVAAAPTGADPQRMARGAAIAHRLRCGSCHGADYAGGQQVARLARQREDYLNLALTEFRAGKRLGYTGAMAEALAGTQPEELGDLAHYLSHLP